MMRSVLLIFTVLAVLDQPIRAETQQNCNTALTKIAKKAAEKAIADHRDNACAGLKKGPIGIDKTKALELREFSLCETGPVVRASVSVHIWCATSDKAFISAELSGEVAATASANLDTCQVLDADVSSTASIVEAGIQLSDLKKKMREGIEKQIKDYCN